MEINLRMCTRARMLAWTHERAGIGLLSCSQECSGLGCLSRTSRLGCLGSDSLGAVGTGRSASAPAPAAHLFSSADLPTRTRSSSSPRRPLR